MILADCIFPGNLLKNYDDNYIVFLACSVLSRF
jgi:hypothetical protein